MSNTIHYPLPQETHDEGGSIVLQLLDHSDQLMTDEYIMISYRESRRRNGRTLSILVLGMRHTH
jgi:hypothetical protein